MLAPWGAVRMDQSLGVGCAVEKRGREAGRQWNVGTAVGPPGWRDQEGVRGGSVEGRLMEFGAQQV